MKTILSSLLLLLTSNIFSQINRPKSILVSKYYYSPKTLALVVRFDKGIDSISFPVNKNLIKTDVKKLDINGKKISPKKVYYEYLFTPLIDTIYKLPSVTIWSDNEKYETLKGEYVHLKKIKEIVKLSSKDSLINEQKKLQNRNKRLKLVEKERLEGKIESRISKNITKQIVLLWSDKKTIKINDKFRIVIQSNKDFNTENITIDYMNTIIKNIEFTKRITSSTYENGLENHYIVFICKALKKERIKINKLKVKTKNKIFKTNEYFIDVIN